MRVVVTNKAKADLVEIGEFIRQNNPARAITFVDPKKSVEHSKWVGRRIRSCFDGAQHERILRASTDFFQVDEILDHCTSLADMPLAYTLIPRYEHHGIRRCAYRDYLVFYRVIEDRVEVIHILHGARNYEVLLFPDEGQQIE